MGVDGFQSLSGRHLSGTSEHRKIPVIAICGSLEEDLPAFPSHHIEVSFPHRTGPCEVVDALLMLKGNWFCARNIGNLLK